MKKYCIVILLILALFSVKISLAICRGKFLNPISEVDWSNIFPITIAGITISGGSGGTYPGSADSAGGSGYGTFVSDSSGEGVAGIFCKCPNVIGIPVSFWSPDYILDAVTDPGCFPAWGFRVNIASRKQGYFEQIEGRDSSSVSGSFMEAHLSIVNFIEAFKILKDLACFDVSGINIGYMTELDPAWHNDAIADMITPESILFAFPAFGFSCMADSITSALGHPLDVLFYCMGTWRDVVYPFVGFSEQNVPVNVHAATAGKLLYKLIRSGLIWDNAVSVCEAKYIPIWIKSHYRFQPVRPIVVHGRAPYIGALTEKWSFSPRSISGTNNWSFILWRKNRCCIGLPL